jgi:L-fuconate dehydratase
VQHLAMADFVAVTGQIEDRAIEFVDHLHEHFVDPARIRNGRYLAPTSAGFSAQMRPEALVRYRFPGGAAWRTPHL